MKGYFTPARSKRWLYGLVAVNCIIAFAYLVQYGLFVASGQTWQADFTSFYAAWVMVRDGHGAALYSLAAQAQYQTAILEGRSFADGVLPFLYPPQTALLFVPLGLLPLAGAYLLWAGWQGVMLVYLLVLLWRSTHGWQRIERWLVLSTVLVMPALLINLVLGSFSLWMTICLLQFVLAFQRNDDAAAGFWLAMGCIKPQLMLVPCALLLGARRWRALGSGVVYGGILFGVSSGVLGWHIWLDWVRQVGTLPALFVRDAYNLRGALVLLLGEAALPLATGITSGLLLLVLAGTIWQGRRIAAADAAPASARRGGGAPAGLAGQSAPAGARYAAGGGAGLLFIAIYGHTHRHGAAGWCYWWWGIRCCFLALNRW
ncbi:MAG: DUF2029 domain-containing protein [Chloroflexaceae bacterium]|nr:DUF2029 domain-containing protein [Chloroflexaceae bacterium]